MTHLLLYDRQRDLAVHDVRHKVTVPEAVNREHLQVSARRVFSINLLQSGLGDVILKNLPDTVFCEWLIPASSGVKQVCLGPPYPVITLGDDPLLLEHALYFIG